MAKRKRPGEDDDFLTKFKYNYNNTPGYESMVKIIFFIAIALTLIITARSAISEQHEKDKAEEEFYRTSVVPQQTTSLKKLLDALLEKKTSITITQGETQYMFENVEDKDGVVSGLFETINGAKKFKIKNNTIYEIVLSNEVENNSLFDNLNLDFIIPSRLVKILESNKTIKKASEDNVTYTYSITIDEVPYEINVIIVKDEIASISIASESIQYTYVYK